MIDKIIFELLLKDGNETNFIKNYDVYFNFQELIKELIKNKELADFIKEYCYKDIFKDISELVTNYEPKIAKGIYED